MKSRSVDKKEDRKEECEWVRGNRREVCTYSYFIHCSYDTQFVNDYIVCCHRIIKGKGD